MRLSRRQSLGHLALALAAAGTLGGVPGCGSAPVSPNRIRTLRLSLSKGLLQDFQKRSGQRLGLELADRRAELFRLLQQELHPSPPSRWDPRHWFGSPRLNPPPLLSLLGSDWLASAIGQALIQPLDPLRLDVFLQQLPPLWQTAAQYPDADQYLLNWGIPWRWGVTAIAYRRSQVKQPITDWADLWRPELQGRITLPDHPREVIGLVLKRLGYSYNDHERLADPALKEHLLSLQPQVKTYTSEAYLPMLRMGDSWVAVGWTEDLYAALPSDSDIEVVIPRSGSALWWDMWVVPNRPEPFSPVERILQRQWLSYALDPQVATRAMLTSSIASTIPWDPQSLSTSLRHRPDLDPQVLAQAELLQPLTPDLALRYLHLWQQVRQQA